jgi:hypothetical protein
LANLDEVLNNNLLTCSVGYHLWQNLVRVCVDYFCRLSVSSFPRDRNHTHFDMRNVMAILICCVKVVHRAHTEFSLVHCSAKYMFNSNSQHNSPLSVTNSKKIKSSHAVSGISWLKITNVLGTISIPIVRVWCQIQVIAWEDFMNLCCCVSFRSYKHKEYS